MHCETFVFLLISCIAVTAIERNYYCNDIPEDIYSLGDYDRSIITTVEKGKSYYSHNQTCFWVIKTGVNRRIKLYVKYSHLHIPRHHVKTYCESYDHVVVRDSKNKNLAEWCGRDNPKEIISKDDELRVVFKSNGNNRHEGNYRGVQIIIRTFDNTSCPPGWLVFEDSCYAMTKIMHKWGAAQRECNQRQSNLVTLEQKESLKFLTKEILNKTSEMYLWTGLNGLVEDDQKLRWIDKSAPKKVKGFAIPGWDSMKRCGVIHCNQALMYMQDCEHVQLYALCQSQKDTPTQLYKTPDTGLGHQMTASDNSGQIMLGVIIPVLIILTLIVVAVLVMNTMGIRFPTFWTSVPTDEV